jgi:hypothetical protein
VLIDVSSMNTLAGAAPSLYRKTFLSKLGNVSPIPLANS